MDDFIANELENNFKIQEYECIYTDSCNDIISKHLNNIFIFHINIRSVERNWEELILKLNNLNKKPDIIILSETFTNDESPTYHLPEYNYVTTKININKNSGLVIFLHDKLSIVKITEHPIHLVNCIEIQFKLEKTIYHILAIYRTHGSNISSFITEFKHILLKFSNKLCFIAGDFNININENVENNYKNEYINCMTEFNFISCINKNTREIKNHTPSCLDHIWTNINVKDIDKIKSIVWKTNITDHHACILLYDNKIKPKKTHLTKKRSYTNMTILREKLRNEQWNNVLNSYDTETCSKNFENTLSQHIKNSTTESTVHIKSKLRILKPWITQGLIISIRNKEKLYKTALKNPLNEKALIFYKKFKNKLTYCIKKNKEDYFKNKILSADNNNKQIWKTVNLAMDNTKKTQNIKYIEHENKIIDANIQPKQCANIFNSFFANVGKNLAKNINKPFNPKTQTIENVQNQNYLSKFETTSESEILKIIEGMKGGSSPGFDNISVHILKSMKIHLVKPITHLINLSLTEGIFPTNYKNTIISPIYKSGDPQQVTNYRPICLISNIGKIFEKIVKNQLVNFLESNKILHKNQFGFIKSLSTQDAIANVTSYINESLDKGKKCAGIFIDLRKAFDSISHEILLKKLNNIGIKDNAIKWISNYLKNRPQVVKINQINSDKEISDFGIPQGTVIGPILFSIYVNDIFFQPLHGQITSYADDTVLIISEKTWESVTLKATEDINILKNFFDVNLLSLNSDKTFVVPFAIHKNDTPKNFEIIIHDNSKTHNQNYCISNCTILKTTNTIKYLGVIIDKNLKWKEQICQVVKKIRKLIYIFLRIRNFLSLNNLYLIYYALVQSNLQYAIISWGSAYKTNISPIEVVQRLIIKIILKKPSDYPTDQLFKEFQVPSFKDLYNKNALIQIIKEKDKYQFITENRTRHKYIFPCPKLNTSFAQNYYTYQGRLFFNQLPEEIRNINDKIRLINTVKKYFKDNLKKKKKVCD